MDQNDLLCINTIRTLSMDAVQKANSGHPGTPMALAPVVYTLWKSFLRFDPDHPVWYNRDRFVLSNGHASMLLYSMLYLTGTKAVDEHYETPGTPAVSMEDIQNFRQMGSKAPGHPEYHLVSGVETTTGPLGQGVASSVGMAISSKWLAAKYNRPGFELFNFDVYAICGDGDMMEGVSSEAASNAGHLKLSNLCWIYDNNHITIEGSTKLAFTEDVATRFMAYGWNVLRVSDANDTEKMSRALESFKATRDRPTFIIVDSHIAYGAPHKQDTKEAHGEALGEDEVRAAKRFYGWPEDKHFYVPKEVSEIFKNGFSERSRSLRQTWDVKLAAYAKEFPKLAEELRMIQDRELPKGWDKDLPTFPADAKGLGSRDASSKVLNRLAQNVPWLLGGAADLSPSTKTNLSFDGAGDFEPENYAGRNLHFGIREHSMGSILNGMAVSKLRAYGSTFLIFSDYEKPAIRLSALMEIPTIQIFTHDSIGLGEDGPTHQPVEQLASLRSVPGLITLRPGDANEVTEAWKVIMQLKHQPAALILSRQNIPTLDRSLYKSASGVSHGAYILAEAPSGSPEIILMPTGSEVPLAVQAYEELKKKGIEARVVSMPSWEIFEKQSPAYREEVLPASVTRRISIEQASTFGWDRYIGSGGVSIGMKTFGVSAPLKEVLKHFGFTVEHVVQVAQDLLKRR